jgi:hypothetical protein
MAIFDNIGALSAAPLLAHSLTYGLNKGNVLIGLPFFIVATMYGVSGISVWSLRASATNWGIGKPVKDNLLI